MLMGIGRDCRDPIALADAELRQRRAPKVAALRELRISESQIAVYHRLAPAIQLARAARKFQRRQRSFHALKSTRRRLSLANPAAACLTRMARKSLTLVSVGPVITESPSALKKLWASLS